MQQPQSVIINREEIKKVISNAVYSRFGEGTVATVDISFDEDGFDMDVVDVVIVLNRTIDKTLLSGFSLKLRNELDKLNSDSFPLVSFIARKEYERRRNG
jgi:hypothetical protein